MDTFTFLTMISVIGAAALFVALAIYLHLIIRELEGIGGTPTSFLAKIRLGVRAIESETDLLPVNVVKLNGGLTQVRDGLRGIDDNLGELIDAVGRQGG